MLLLIAFGLNFGQGKVADTINVVTLQKFKIPSDRNIVFSNILDFKVSANILDENGNVIRASEHIWQSPSQKEFKKEVAGGRGATVQFSFNDMIEKPGTYFLEAKIRIKDENRRSITIPAKYQVNVAYPTMASEISLRDGQPYYYTEKETFSFATIEFEDPNKYSYQIVDPSEKILQQGRGAIVELDTVFKDLGNVGKKLTIKGFYDGKQFYYKSNGDTEPKLSEWVVDLQQPKFTEFHDWLLGSTESKSQVPLVISVYNESAKKLLYTYGNSTSEGNFVFVAPKIRSLQVRSEPEGLIVNKGAVPSGVFVNVFLDYDQEALNLIEECGQLDGVKLHVEFVTQFNERISRDYIATLIK
ncbi:MAG: hypothetical protein D6830_04995 [Ignavibacteria bacterium]|nr:MAG: hypothetical protein D6830_04995 [Ignavibacteria bacterium]